MTLGLLLVLPPDDRRVEWKIEEIAADVLVETLDLTRIKR